MLRSCDNPLVDFYASESSKNQLFLFKKKQDGQAFRSAEGQKSAREFSHDLDLSQSSWLYLKGTI